MLSVSELLILANLFTHFIDRFDGEGDKLLHGPYFSLSSDEGLLFACEVVLDNDDVFVLHCSNDSGTVISGQA